MMEMNSIALEQPSHSDNQPQEQRCRWSKRSSPVEGVSMLLLVTSTGLFLNCLYRGSNPPEDCDLYVNHSVLE